MSFKVTGRVQEAESGNGIPNLIIEAFDKDMIKSDKLGKVKTAMAALKLITIKQIFKANQRKLKAIPIYILW